MIGLRWLFQMFWNRHDPGLVNEAARFGAKPIQWPYDQTKAVAGFRRSRRQSDTGRKYRARVKSKVRGSVVPIRKVGR